MKAAERWQRLHKDRHAVLARARDCSALTVPGLIPPEGHTESSALVTPFQSLGARGVNNLASKLLLALFPPGTAFFRLSMNEAVKAQVVAAGGEIGQMESALSVIEQSVSKRIETEGYRPALFEVMKHLIVGGNALLHLTDKMRMYRIDQYCIQRSPNGSPIEAVICEKVSPAALPMDVRVACQVDETKIDTPVDVYTVIQWKDGRTTEWQEINGHIVPGSEGNRPEAKTEWLPLRWAAVPGQSYGRGLVEEYLGDLRSLEGLTEAVVNFAAVVSKIVFLTRPGGVTKWKDITKAASGSAVPGLLDDVKVLQVEKFADFQVAKAVIDELTLRLSHAFLLRSGTVRNAERVTAEEIRQMAQELEDVLGGVYTVQAQELQLPLVKRLMARMTASKEIPALPSGTVAPVIVTGFDALGRNHSVNRLRYWLSDLVAVAPDAMATLKVDAIAKRLGVGHGVEDLESLFKTPEEMQAEQQKAQMMAMADKAVGPAAQAVSKSVTQQ